MVESPTRRGDRAAITGAVPRCARLAAQKLSRVLALRKRDRKRKAFGRWQSECAGERAAAVARSEVDASLDAGDGVAAFPFGCFTVTSHLGLERRETTRRDEVRLSRR